MLKVANTKNRIVERIIQDKNGNFFRTYFLIVERGGKFVGRLIRIEKLNIEDSKLHKENIYLPTFGLKKTFQLSTFNFQLVQSPYFLNTFFTSQMTRAPSASV